MAGYTPLFDSLTKGTLCGKWPDIGLWPVVLSMADRHGIVDVTHQYIATVTGLELEHVVACMERFCEPDLHSRTQDQDGRRLVRLEDGRDWGWKVINHGKYAEKARLIHKNAREVEQGRNRNRLAKRNGSEESTLTADDRRSPPMTADDRPSSSSSLSSKEDICLVFEHWREVHQHPRAALDAKRKKVITSALKSYPVDDLKLAIDGCKASPFHQGENDRNAKYDSLALILRDAEQIDKFMALATQPVQTKKLRLLTDA